MRRFDLSVLWIDRECIPQRECNEKKIALHAMDLVYAKSNHPVALLSMRIRLREDLALLTQLMSGELVCKSRTKFNLAPTLDRQHACKVLKLLEAITSDDWWTRAWTFQENYRGAEKMSLLLPHTQSLEHPKRYRSDLFDSIPGELRINSAEFHMAATAFCLAFIPTTDSEKKTREFVLGKAPRYSFLLREVAGDSDMRVTQAMSHQIIRNIGQRNLDVPWDRLAIVANCCQYSIRLDHGKLKKRSCSMSVSMLALFLLNGEIMHNGLYRTTGASQDEALSSFLEAQAFDEFYPPGTKKGLTFNKRCRFIDVTFATSGIQTSGHLWSLGPLIESSTFSSGLPLMKEVAQGRLSQQKSSRLRQLAVELQKRGYVSLSNQISWFLTRGRYGGSVKSFAIDFLQAMASEVADAIDNGKSLRMARLYDSRDVPNSYTSICVWDEKDDGMHVKKEEASDYGQNQQRTTTHVFTASKPAHRNRLSMNDLDRHVSLEVDCDFDSSSLPSLYTRRWNHGLYFFWRCPRVEVMFPWPRAISECGTCI
ncbi:hypothetical protein BKA56DRAFT_602692 [Ilyonectria sp. MPI-CAGE-AT-0026]|nr:hypothetical protein BKA56DRAFT_602692 [Ilyonectria sp. MPI-CAGE-AT-0026]